VSKPSASNDMQDVPALAGVHHLKLPVSDLARSRRWYRSRLGYEVTMEFVEQGRLMGYVLEHPNGGPQLALRLAPVRARAAAGFDYFAIGVPGKTALDELAARLTALAKTTTGCTSPASAGSCPTCTIPTVTRSASTPSSSTPTRVLRALSPSRIRARPPSAASANGAPWAPRQASAPEPASTLPPRSPGCRVWRACFTSCTHGLHSGFTGQGCPAGGEKAAAGRTTKAAGRAAGGARAHDELSATSPPAAKDGEGRCRQRSWERVRCSGRRRCAAARR
jgi:hypothetical protein